MLFLRCNLSEKIQLTSFETPGDEMTFADFIIRF